MKEIKDKPDSLPTVRKLVNSYLDIEHEKFNVLAANIDHDNLEEFHDLQNEQELIEEQMLTKTNNIKHVLTALDMSEASINGEREVLAKYKNDLQTKLAQIKKAKDRVKELIIDIVEHAGEPTKTGGMTIKTDLGKFTTYETNGPVKLIARDAYNYPKEVTKRTISVDKIAIKKQLKDSSQNELVNSNGDVVARIEKVRRLKISWKI